MTIERLDIYHVRMPLRVPFRTAYGEDHTIETVLVRLSRAGVQGWGESCPLSAPTYSPEWAGGVFATITQHLAPRLLHASIDSGDDLQAHLAPIKGNPFAKAALDMAWWDAEARRVGEPLWRLLGGAPGAVSVGADFGVADSREALKAQIGEALEAGFKRVKLKARPGWDTHMLDVVRASFPDATIHVDCNGGYTLAELDTLRAMDRAGLAMIEQPLEAGDLLDHAELARQIDGAPGDRRGRVPMDQRQAGARGRAHRGARGACADATARRARLGRWHAGIRGRHGALPGAGDVAAIPPLPVGHLPRRPFL